MNINRHVDVNIFKILIVCIYIHKYTQSTHIQTKTFILYAINRDKMFDSTNIYLVKGSFLL